MRGLSTGDRHDFIRNLCDGDKVQLNWPHIHSPN